MRILTFLLLFTAVCLLSGCVDVRYIGDVYPATTSVRFYMDEKDIPANTYRQIGIAIASIDEEDAAFSSGNVLSDALREKAMEVGADAILIESSTRYAVGSRTSGSSNTYYSEKSKVKGKHNRNHTRAKSKTYGYSDTYSSGSSYDIQRDEVRAKFLKRKSAD